MLPRDGGFVRERLIGMCRTACRDGRVMWMSPLRHAGLPAKKEITTMERKQKDWFGPHRLYLGIDVGRPFLRAVGLEPDGTIEIIRRQDRCQEDVDALLDEAGEGALVNRRPEEQHRLAYRAQIPR